MSNPLSNMNPRERRLLVLTVSLVLVAAAVLGLRAAMAKLHSLDDQVAQLEFELENLQQQYVQRDAVDAAYKDVITENSSNLTVAEIHDNLRREIFRLAEVPLPATKDKPAHKMQLVHIPTLEEGQLSNSKGHREYRIQIDVPIARLDRLLTFMQRIETSDQLLRIDSVEIGRVPSSQWVHAALEITRTVLDNPETMDTETRGAPA